MASTPTRDLPEEILAATRKSQETVIRAIRTWVETVRTVTPRLPSVSGPLADRLPKLPSVTVPFAGRLPSPEDVVASGYDFAEQLLAVQRKFAEDLLAATEPLMPGNGKRVWKDATKGDAATAAHKTVADAATAARQTASAAKAAATGTAQAAEKAVAESPRSPRSPNRTQGSDGRQHPEAAGRPRSRGPDGRQRPKGARRQCPEGDRDDRAQGRRPEADVSERRREARICEARDAQEHAAPKSAAAQEHGAQERLQADRSPPRAQGHQHPLRRSAVRRPSAK